MDSKSDKDTRRNSKKTSVVELKVGSGNGTSSSSSSTNQGGGTKRSRRRRKQKDSNKEKPLSVDEALKQADAALSAAVETRHLAGSGSAAVKARKKSNSGAGRNDSQWRQSAM